MIVNYFSDLYDDLHKQKVPFFKYQRGGDVGLYLSFYRTKISINPGNILIYVILCNILATSDFAETADLFTRSVRTSLKKKPSAQANFEPGVGQSLDRYTMDPPRQPGVADLDEKSQSW